MGDGAGERGATQRLLAEADALYGLPPSDFTAARDARAAELKGEDRDLAAAVKALRKPVAAAWAVDLLVRREPDRVGEVLRVGEALREAQQGMDAAELRALTKQRRQLTAAVTGRARSHAAEAGVRLSAAVADQVEATLTAAMADAGCAEAVRSGLLVQPLSATGVDAPDVAAALAVPEAAGFAATPAAAPEPSPPSLSVVPDPDADEKAREAARAEARERLDGAEEELAARREAEGAADEEVQALQARSMQLAAEVDELRRRIADLEATAEEVDEELEEAEAVLEEAREEAAGAQRERDAAREALDALP